MFLHLSSDLSVRHDLAFVERNVVLNLNRDSTVSLVRAAGSIVLALA